MFNLCSYVLRTHACIQNIGWHLNNPTCQPKYVIVYLPKGICVLWWWQDWVGLATMHHVINVLSKETLMLLICWLWNHMNASNICLFKGYVAKQYSIYKNWHIILPSLEPQKPPMEFPCLSSYNSWHVRNNII